jgi:hypothetical protein
MSNSELLADAKNFVAISKVTPAMKLTLWERRGVRLIKELVRALKTATKTRTVTTVEELDELTLRSVLLDSAGIVWERDYDGSWLSIGQDREWSQNNINLPATVLFTPEATS